MQGFYVFLAIAGIVCVILSFLLSERLESKMQEKEISVSDEMLAALFKKNEGQMEAVTQNMIKNCKENAIEDTTKALNRLTNEKIMAVDEFSDTVLEKINQNHSEVIFLYNMLNEKEKELKELVSTVNQTGKNSVVKNNSSTGKPVAKAAQQEKQSNTTQEKKESKKEAVKETKLSLSEPEKKKEAHTREEILAMHNKGLSITDIAQQLKTGKGEIKLIIDLYQGAK